MSLRSWSLGIALGAFFLPLAASASLGENAASVRADQLQMNAAVRTTEAAGFTLYEMQTPSGTLVREYVSMSGLVFAVTWVGPSLPDLHQLLGSFFASYVHGANASGAGARPRVVEQPGLVVYAGGRMRAFLGKAFAPALMPNGVSLEEIH
jgi:hypothetical protein